MTSRSTAGPSAEEYAFAWFVFVVVVGSLFLFDVYFLQVPLSVGRISFQTAVKLTLFWVVTGLVFNIFIAGYLGMEQGVGFLQGYLLEYMLSFDNLFVFHLVFSYYCTPEALLYRALCFGIAGAIVLRVVFLAVGYQFMNSGLYIFKLGFGLLLIWSGYKSANSVDDDEEHNDPTKNQFITWVTKHLPVSDSYEPHGNFFITVAEVEAVPQRTGSASWDPGSGSLEEAPRLDSFEAPSSGLPRLESFEGSSLLDPQRSGAMRAALDGGQPAQGSWLTHNSDSFEVRRQPAKLKKKASLLLLVVIAVWVVDLVFAVDSVASKLASVDDIFLNCASSAFAMLSLRSLYFVMESLVQMFQMLKYGIAAILVLIGLKLIFAEHFTASPGVLFAVIVAICVSSIASSYWMPSLSENCERIDLGTMGSIAEDGEEDNEFDRITAPYAAREGDQGTSGSGTRLLASTDDDSGLHDEDRYE